MADQNNQGDDAAEKISRGLANLLERILDKGLAINGQIRIDRLVLTSVDKGREIGLLPATDELKGQQSPNEQLASGQGISEQLEKLIQEVGELKKEIHPQSGRQAYAQQIHAPAQNRKGNQTPKQSQEQGQQGESSTGEAVSNTEDHGG